MVSAKTVILGGYNKKKDWTENSNVWLRYSQMKSLRKVGKSCKKGFGAFNKGKF